MSANEPSNWQQLINGEWHGLPSLYEPDGTPLDEMEYLPQIADWSTARFPDGTASWDVDTTPTPDQANGTTNDE